MITVGRKLALKIHTFEIITNRDRFVIFIRYAFTIKGIRRQINEYADRRNEKSEKVL